MSEGSGAGGPPLAQLSKLLDEALPLSPEEQERWLAALGPEDAPLRPLLTELLVKSANGAGGHPGFLGTLPRLTGNSMLLTPSCALVREEEQIGPYRLLQLLAEGGMGQVWLAEQVQPVRRKVALKLIKGGMDSTQVLARFESEHQALALMDHPAIAKVFDGGTTPQGGPYFVMEYLPGMPVNRYCEEQRLTTVQRLELFCQVCEGVQHAHQKAVIHRDLKPSNVLVMTVDDRPQPRIIDFGVAKALGQQLSHKTLITEVGAFIGTPEYMSPEQADLGPQGIDTRTDVYALGVILYELLTGALPFSSKELRDSSLDELRRKIREVDPPRPSTRLNTPGQISERRSRGGDQRSLAGQLRGDLDAITMKALEKDRRRRYATPSDLAADIQRHLRHEPVLARSPSTGYKVARYIRRHRVGVGVASALLVLLVTFAVTATLQAWRIRRESAAAQRVSDFLTGMFKLTDPGEARGNSVTARELLDRASAEVGTSLATEPELQGRMMGVMGNAYVGLGLYPKAEPLLARAYQLKRATRGAGDPATIDAAAALGGLYSRQGRRPEAEKLLSESLERCRRALGPDHRDCLGTANVLGTVMLRLGRYEEAQRLHRETLEARRRTLGPDHRETVASMLNLANVYLMEKRFADAVTIYREGLDAWTRLLGPDHPDTLALGHNLAEAYLGEGRLDEAEPLQRRTLEAQQGVLGPDHPTTLSSASSLGETLTREGKLDEGEALLRATAETQTRVLGSSHPQVARTLQQLALVRLRRGDGERALDLLEQAVRSGLSAAERAEWSTDEDYRELRGMPRFEALAKAPVH